jgi:hypothetical protein
MSYIFLNLFPQRDRGRLDPDQAIIRLQQHFPDAVLLPGDQLTQNAHMAAKQLDTSNRGNRAVAEKLARDARELGPANAFRIPTADGPPIQGVSRRFQADFHSDAPIPHALRARMIAFLNSLIPNGMTIAVGEEHDTLAAPRLRVQNDVDAIRPASSGRMNWRRPWTAVRVQIFHSRVIRFVQIQRPSQGLRCRQPTPRCAYAGSTAIARG